MSNHINKSLRLGVNVDHVATIRNARGGKHPDPVAAAIMAETAGADGITAHLREDRRHITDDDVARLMENLSVPLNLEMAAEPEMLEITLRHRPHAVCIVPERREERTTEGGLDVAGAKERLLPMVGALSEAGIRVSLFIEPDRHQIDASREIGAAVVEIHTGAYCDASLLAREQELIRIQEAVIHATALGLECHAGHGLSFDTVMPIAAILSITELNIGHFLIGEAVFTGLSEAIKKMRLLMDRGRKLV